MLGMVFNLGGLNFGGVFSPLRFMIFPFGGVTFILFFVFSLLLYFLPSVVAFRRNHPNSTAILLLNIFLGWTFLGWIIALIWSFTSPQTVIVQQTPYNPYPVPGQTPYPETQRSYAPVGAPVASQPQTYIPGSRPPEILPPDRR